MSAPRISIEGSRSARTTAPSESETIRHKKERRHDPKI
jgi:hypothetical protein